MKRATPAIFAAVFLISGTALAWDVYEFDLPSQAPEALWRDALAAELSAQHEVRIEGGRIDVMTDDMAIEIDWPHKWHEGLGQALHYSDATGKQAVLALISYSQGPEHLKASSRERFEMVEKYCSNHNVKLMLLFPKQPRAYGSEDAHQRLYGDSTNYWLNTNTGVRHRPGCRFYESSLHGRACGAEEGRPCKFCGGD